MAIFLIIISILLSSTKKNINLETINYRIMGGPNDNYEDNLYNNLTLKFNTISFKNINKIEFNEQEKYKLAYYQIKSIDQNENLINEQKINSKNNNQKINFILPTSGLNWGKLHPKNAVDIAASCGNDVFAAADGLVIELANSGWNSGYGKYIKIEHLNNIKTVYAHLNSLNVYIGDYVKQGQKIGTVGQTGEATGCHVHFEVLGDKNPFIK